VLLAVGNCIRFPSKASVAAWDIATPGERLCQVRKAVVTKSTLSLPWYQALMRLWILGVRDHVSCEAFFLHKSFAANRARERVGIVAVKDLVDAKASGVQVTLVAAREIANEVARSSSMALHINLKILLALEIFLAALMTALVRSVGLMHILVGSTKVLLGRCSLAMRALERVYSNCVVSKYVISGIPLAFVDLYAEIAGQHLVFWVMGLDVAVELASLLVGFIATFTIAFERAANWRGRFE
jgi:hypothetical protein